ncbi:M56 family metallopeptidase [Gracilimonas sp.]|uniref:M56 family metallopeptidase n=1 Tax=Gracilimonas sp. TaxID=1974203 RepID=UPI003BAB74C9
MIIYIVKSTLLLGLLFGVYKLLLENEKMHRFNRFFLLFALLFGLTAPLISFDVQPEQSVAGIKIQDMERVVNAPAEAVSKSVGPLIAPEPKALPKTNAEITPATTEESSWSISMLDLLLGMYGLVTVFLLVRFAGGLLEIRNKIMAGSHKEMDEATLVLLDESITPQSFLGYIFLEKKQFESGEIEPEILDHEITHIRQWHSLDVLFIEFLKVIFWFNPLMYLYKHAIQLNHEFLADESVVSNGSSVSDYQNMLIRFCGEKRALNTTSSINYSLTKKRLKMIPKKFSALRSGSKGLLLAPILLAATLMFCTRGNGKPPYKITGNSDELYSNVDLYMNPERSKELNIKRRGIGIRYDSDGNPFTGTLETRYTKNDQLLTNTVFSDGVIKSSEFYNPKTGELVEKSEFGYIGEQFKRIRVYSSDEILIEEWSDFQSGKLGYHKKWHENGQLEYEAYFSGPIKDETLKATKIPYQGLMTLYDEQGIIIEQERYEDGELIEKIK